METILISQQTKHTLISLDNNGILRLEIARGAEVDLEEIRGCFRIYEEMGINKSNKVLQIIHAPGDSNMTKEGRHYAAEKGRDYFKAAAVIGNSLAIRLVVNFFNNFYKSWAIPFCMFETEEAALRWLKKIE